LKRRLTEHSRRFTSLSWNLSDDRSSCSTRIVCSFRVLSWLWQSEVDFNWKTKRHVIIWFWIIPFAKHDFRSGFDHTCSLSTVTLREKRIRNISDSTRRFSRSSIFFALSNEVNYIWKNVNFTQDVILWIMKHKPCQY